MRARVITLIAIGFIVLLAILGPILLPKHHYRELIEEEFEKRIPYNVEITDVKFRLLPFPAFIIKNISLADSDGREFAIINKLRGDVSWYGLITADFDIKLAITGVAFNVYCGDRKCNIDALFSADEKKPIIRQQNLPPPPNSDVPVVEVPEDTSFLNLILKNAYASNNFASRGRIAYTIKQLRMTDAELHYYQDGVERLEILNLNAKLDPTNRGYVFAMAAGKRTKPVLVLKGAIDFDRRRGNAFSKNIVGQIFGINFNLGFNYCSSCNPRLQKWSINAPEVAPQKLNSVLGTFDLELPTIFEWGGKMGVRVSEQVPQGINFDIDLTETEVNWENIFSKQQSIVQHVSFTWLDGKVNGKVSLSNNDFLISGDIGSGRAYMKGAASNFDIIAVKGIMPILTNIGVANEPRIEGIFGGPTYSFPDGWAFNGNFTANNINAFDIDIKNPKASIIVSDGLFFPRIEGEVFGGKLTGEGEIKSNIMPEHRFGILISNADLSRIPVVREIMAGSADVIIEQNNLNREDTLKGSIVSNESVVVTKLGNTINNINSYWRTLGGVKGLKDELKGVLSNVRVFFRREGSEYLIDELTANWGNAALRLSGSVDQRRGDLLFNGNLGIPDGKRFAGAKSRYLLAKDGNLNIPIIIEGSLQKFRWILDDAKIAELKLKAPKEESKPLPKKVISKPERRLKLAKPKIRRVPKPKPTPRKPKKQEEDFFKITIGG